MIYNNGLLNGKLTFQNNILNFLHIKTIEICNRPYNMYYPKYLNECSKSMQKFTLIILWSKKVSFLSVCVSESYFLSEEFRILPKNKLSVVLLRCQFCQCFE